MQDAKDPKRELDQTAKGGTSKDPDATSSETLSDIEEKEKVANTGDKNRPNTSSTPSPDGALEDERTQHDDAGPM